MVRKAAAYIGGLITRFSSHNGLTQASALAFYTALSFAPLVLLLMSVGGLVGERTKYELLGQFSRELGSPSARLAQGVVRAAARSAHDDASGWRTTIGTVGLLAAASAVFGQLQAALNTIWGVVAKPAALSPHHGRMWTVSITAWEWSRKRLLSMGMVLVVLFILLASLVLSAAISAALLSTTLGGLSARITELATSFVVATLLFAAIFKVLPDAPTPWRHAWLGAAMTSVFFNGGKLLLSVYIDKAGVGKEYGEAVGGLVALLVWVYYSSVALLLGAEVTRMLSDSSRESGRGGGEPRPAAPEAPGTPVASANG